MKWRCCAKASRPTCRAQPRAKGQPPGRPGPLLRGLLQLAGHPCSLAGSCATRRWPWLRSASMQSRTVRLYHDHVLVKEPGTRQRTPRTRTSRTTTSTACRTSACGFRSIRCPVRPRWSSWRSHKRPVAHAAHLHGQPGQGGFRGQPGRPAQRRGRPYPAFPIVGWEIEPGDVVFSHAHAACGGWSRGTNRRRVFSVRFLGDDTRAMRPGHGRHRPSFLAGGWATCRADEPSSVPCWSRTTGSVHGPWMRGMTTMAMYF